MLTRDRRAWLEQLQTFPAPLLALVALGHLDARELCREELKNRGMDDHGTWIGFDHARDSEHSESYEGDANVSPSTACG